MTLRRQPRLAAPQRPHPREDLAEGVRLREVVVGAGVEAGHPVVHGVAGGEHQHRRGHAGLPHAGTEVEAAPAGEHHVEDDDVGAAVPGALQPRGEGGRVVHLQPLLAQAFGQDPGLLEVVFDQKDTHGARR